MTGRQGQVNNRDGKVSYEPTASAVGDQLR